jgi:predicted nucleotide-binding protein (sugar kinase/HSP70/actin superfamily)
LASWFVKRASARPVPARKLRIGIPRVLNQWSTHQFWIAFFGALGIEQRGLVFSSETSAEQYADYGQGRGTVDCCYPVKCLAGHYGELLYGQKRKIDVLFSPMVYSLPSFLRGSVVDNLTCPRVMAAPENIKAGFTREKDLFAELGVRHVAPVVSLAEPALAAKQLHEALAPVLAGLTRRETEMAVAAAYAALQAFDRRLREKSRDILGRSAESGKPCLLLIGRPYHMDPGIGHEIETELQAYGYPVLWGQYLPTDPDILDWLFGDDVVSGAIGSPFDISDVWRSSYSANTNEILWAAKYAARMPWIACVVRFSSYECGMDQPTYTPVQAITESSGTLFFSFQDLDSTKPAGSVKIRTETIAYYLERHAQEIIATKLARLSSRSPSPLPRASGEAAA